MPYYRIQMLAALGLAAMTAVPSQEAKPPLAKVTIAGKESAVLGGEAGKDRHVVLELDGQTKVSVYSDRDVAKIHKEILDQHEKLNKEFAAQLKLLIEKNDFEKHEQLAKQFHAAGDELLDQLGYCAAEGTLMQVGDDLRLQGKLRVIAYKGADKALGKGKALVEGEAIFIKPKNDKTTLSPQLAIRNGDKAIFITGKVAAGHANAKGTIRAWGVLRSGGKDVGPVLEAEKIEVVK